MFRILNEFLFFQSLLRACIRIEMLPEMSLGILVRLILIIIIEVLCGVGDIRKDLTSMMDAIIGSYRINGIHLSRNCDQVTRELTTCHVCSIPHAYRILVPTYIKLGCLKGQFKMFLLLFEA
jgi:hypothetical protein